MPRLRLLLGLSALAALGCGEARTVTSAPNGTIESRSGLSLRYGLQQMPVRLVPPPDGSLPPFASAQTIVRGGKVIKLGAEAFDADGLSASVVTGRPGEGGSVAVYLRDEAGGLVGSAVLPAGAPENELTMRIVPNTASAAIVRSLDDNFVADGVVLRATPLEMTSGYMDGLPGVDRVEIEVSGPAYGDGREVATLGTLRAPNLATYQWRPAVASGTYDPGKLAEPGTPLPFYLTTRAFDADGHEVGVSRVKIAILGTATVTVGVEEP